MNLLARIADRVIGRPLLLHPAKAELIASVLGERIGVEMVLDPAALSPELTDTVDQRPAANRMIGEPVALGRQVLYRRVNGVGVIPIVGTLVNRGLAIGEDSSGFTSYESLRTQMMAALADPQVVSILLDIDSPGGEASGMFATAELIRDARTRKPVTAVVDDMAASAAYGIAANATDIVVSPTSITGSIGVVLMHLDQSAELQMKGRKPTLIFAGAHKVDAHPFGPLTENVRADLQREVDTFYARFVDAVANGRPRMTGDAIRGTEARIFIGSEAIDVGLADRVGSFEETLTRLTSAVRAGNQGRFSMTTQDTIARADHDAAVATARAEGRTEGEAAGRAQAVDRVRAILTCAEAEGREAQAQVFALDSDLTPAIAAKALAASPKATPAAPPVPALAVRGAAPVPNGGGTAERPTEDASNRWDRSMRRAGAKLPV